MGLPLSGVKKIYILTAIFGALFALPAYADSIARSFNAKGNIEPGKVVALSDTDKATVELTPANSTRIYGVAIEKKDAPVTLEQPGQTIFVATGGTYPVFVSAEKGVISPGDYLSMSSTDGVAAKSTRSNTYILGKALQGYSDSSVGKISAEIIPGANPQLRVSTSVPYVLQQVFESLAGKPLSAARIYSALAVFIVAAAIAFSLLWMGVHSGMISIGRNPLSKQSIMQNLAQVILAAVVVFTSGLLGIYLLLRI